jgi:hypothetical protein
MDGHSAFKNIYAIMAVSYMVMLHKEQKNFLHSNTQLSQYHEVIGTIIIIIIITIIIIIMYIN